MHRLRNLLTCLMLTSAFTTAGQEAGAAPWWQTTTIYQIYPRSYMDSDGDGIGDLAGIIGKLDHIRDLGFETIWISPFFDSPQGDFGYDIRDYYGIDPEYGDMELVDDLIAEVHARDMRIVFDLVLNHTSIEHEWFLESSASRDNEKSDFYIWEDGDGRKPPNNWINVFNKKSWHYSEARGQYYYTAFLEFQPDLNWRNPEVQAAMFDMVKHWLAKGVDGFRLDIFNCILEDPDLADNPFVFKMLPSRDAMKAKFQKKTNNINHPDNITLAKRLRDTIDLYSDPGRFLIGEAIGPPEAIQSLVGDSGTGLNLVFIFDMIYFDFSAEFFTEIIGEMEEQFPEPLMPTIVFGNHDNFRRTRRIKNDPGKDRVLTLFQLTARGVPVVYYGEEVGMINASIPKKEALDPISWVFKGLPQFMRNWLPVPVNRDVCRTPMQWTDAPNAGFCPEGATPWLPVSTGHEQRNVASMQGDALSQLNTYRDLLAIRSQEPVLRQGSISLLEFEGVPENTLVYIREHNGERILVAMNFSKQPSRFELRLPSPAEVLYGLYPEDGYSGSELNLSGLGGVVIRLPSRQ